MNPVDSNSSMSGKRRWQFSLGKLLTAVAVCAVVLGYLTNVTSEYEMTIRCRSMPADDRPLEEWLRSQPGIVEVKVERRGDEVHATFVRRDELSFQSAWPPLSELGYSQRQTGRYRITRSLGGRLRVLLSAATWLAAVGIVAAAFALTRRLGPKCRANTDRPPQVQ